MTSYTSGEVAHGEGQHHCQVISGESNGQGSGHDQYGENNVSQQGLVPGRVEEPVHHLYTHVGGRGGGTNISINRVHVPCHYCLYMSVLRGRTIHACAELKHNLTHLSNRVRRDPRDHLIR